MAQSQFGVILDFERVALYAHLFVITEILKGINSIIDNSPHNATDIQRYQMWKNLILNNQTGNKDATVKTES